MKVTDFIILGAMGFIAYMLFKPSPPSVTTMPTNPVTGPVTSVLIPLTNVLPATTSSGCPPGQFMQYTLGGAPWYCSTTPIGPVIA